MGIVDEWLTPVALTSIVSATVTAVVGGWLRAKFLDSAQPTESNSKLQCAQTSQHNARDALVNQPELSLAHISSHRNSEQLLMCVNGRVLDVSSGFDFYGSGGPYERFAFADASRALAKMQLNDSSLESASKPADLSDLSDAECDTLLHWERKLADKYPTVGRLKDATRV